MLAPLAIWPTATPIPSATTAGITILAIVAPCDDAPTFSTGRPSLTITISGARCTVPAAAIAFIAANGSSAAFGITGCGGADGKFIPGGGTRPPVAPFALGWLPAAGAPAPPFLS